MLTNKGMDITLSQGDTARFMVHLENFELHESDTVRFSLKAWNANVAELTKAATGLTGDKVYITIPSSFTRKLTPQTYVYDLTVTNKGVLTLNLPARFKVIETAHMMSDIEPDAGEIDIGVGGGMIEPPEISLVVPPDWGRMPDVGNLVSDITGEGNTLTVTKADGKTNTIVLAGGGEGGNVEAATNDMVDAVFNG